MMGFYRNVRTVRVRELMLASSTRASPVWAGALVALSLVTPMLASAQETKVGDVFDPFYRYTENEHQVVFGDTAGETVDPFTGTLSIVRRDLVLPGKAGLDLEIVRTYSSKIWGRSDLLDTEPLLAEKEGSVLGYGWTFHMGRLLNANGCPLETVLDDQGNISYQFPYCAGGYNLITFQAPDGSSRTFYPADGSANLFVSKDYWRLERSCRHVSGGGACVWSSDGVRYEFSRAYDTSFEIGGQSVWPLTAIVDLHGNEISVVYLPSRTGAVESITDTYGRRVEFTYSSGDDGLRLETMTANTKVYSYTYEMVRTEDTRGAGRMPLPGRYRRFLSEVGSPAGTSESYAYGYGAEVERNQYALTSITYASGASSLYSYASVPFSTGDQQVDFAVVSTRSVSGTGLVTANWSYSYVSPPRYCSYVGACATDPYSGESTNQQVTTVTRPDGKVDTYMFIGLGWAASEYVWAVGLTTQITRADRTEVEWFQWDPRSDAPVSGAIFRAPSYGGAGTCGGGCLYDQKVYAPALSRHNILRDFKHVSADLYSGIYKTTFSDWDDYGQPQTISEDSAQGFWASPQEDAGRRARTTTRSYYYDLSDHVLRGRPSTESVCVGGDCVTSSWTYNGPGHARDSETRSGVRTEFYYGDDGDVAGIVNAAGQTLTLSSYSYGVPTQLGFNGLFTESREVSWEGWILSETDGEGHTSTYTLDAIGRLLQTTPPGNNVPTTYAYGGGGAWKTMARGSYTVARSLDGMGRPTSSIDSLGVNVSTDYDAIGNVVFQSYPYYAADGEVGDAMEYDGLGRLTTRTRAYRPSLAVCDVVGACRAYTLYYLNTVQSIVEREGVAVEANGSITGDYTWRGLAMASFGDPNEALLSEASDDSSIYAVLEYQRDAAGNLTAVAPLNKFNTYDSRRYLIAEASPETGATVFARNSIGQVESRTDARGEVVTFGYDAIARPTTVTYSSSPADSVASGYDNASNLISLSSGNGGGFTYAYDELNRMRSQTWTFDGAVYSTAYHYDADGCLDQMTYPSSLVVDASCDALNRPLRLSVGSETVIGDVSYTAAGQMGAMIYGNGVATSVAHDDRGRVSRLVSGTFSDLHYGYDGADNVVSIEDAAVAGSSQLLTYDTSDRLVTSVAVNRWETVSYTYDPFGDRAWMGSGEYSSVYTYDEARRLRSITEGEPFSTMRLTWDAAGRLASSSDGTTYRYDGSGRRVAKVGADGTTLYHHDAAGRVVEETLPDGTTRDYVYLGNRLVAEYTRAPGSTAWTPRWFHTDVLGSVTAVTNAAGEVVAQLEYKPWGEQWSVTGEAGDRQYNGRVYDPGTGFHDYGARMYWPQIGRFISADSYHGRLEEPATLNLYSYVRNNPYKYTDPTGHFDTEARAEMPLGAIVIQGVPAKMPQRGLASQMRMDWLQAQGVQNATQHNTLVASDGRTKRDEPKPKEGFLVRFGTGPETAEQLATDAVKAEANEFPHGVSTRYKDRISGSDKNHRFAPIEEVAKIFEVEQTGVNPKHFTVHLPKPVTPEVAERFNQLFRPKQ